MGDQRRLPHRDKPGKPQHVRQTLGGGMGHGFGVVLGMSAIPPIAECMGNGLTKFDRIGRGKSAIDNLVTPSDYDGIVAAGLRAMIRDGFEAAVVQGLDAARDRAASITTTTPAASEPPMTTDFRPIRDPRVDGFLTAVADAFRSREMVPEAHAALRRISGALQQAGEPARTAGRSLPVCDHLPIALAAARAHQSLATVVDAFESLQPLLVWTPRKSGGANASPNFPEQHANAMIVGPDGLENRQDMQVGVSLLAPHVRYPDHAHEPEEVYLVLSLGRFKHGGSSWFEPGYGGTLYNSPGLPHAMASDSAPLFAIWYLWVGNPDPC